MNTYRSLHLVPIILTVAAACATPVRHGAIAPPEAGSSELGAACAPAVRDEFVRQQALVRWNVYCPGVLPRGFRLARGDDPPDPNALGGSAAPTVDGVSDGDGSFVTRLVGPVGAALVIAQGAGASLFVHRDNSGELIGAPESAPRSPFGDLEGRVLEFPTPSIAAFDDYGHMIIATNLSLDETKAIAADMARVEPPPAADPSPTPPATP